MIANDVEEDFFVIKNSPIKSEIDPVCIDELKPYRTVNI